MSDNSEQTQSQTDVTSSEQMVGLVPMQSEDNNIGVQLIATEPDDDFFGSQAIELNGERHVIVSQAQDPETGELLLVLRGESGEHIAIQSEALSSMVQASGGENIQVAVVSQSDETALTLAADIDSLPSVSTTELNPMTTSLTALPSIIANIPSHTQTTTAATNVVQAIDTPRVSQEEQPSSVNNITPIVSKVLESESDKTKDKTMNPLVSPIPSVPTISTDLSISMPSSEPSVSMTQSVSTTPEASVPNMSSVPSDASTASETLVPMSSLITSVAPSVPVIPALPSEPLVSTVSSVPKTELEPKKTIEVLNKTPTEEENISKTKPIIDKKEKQNLDPKTTNTENISKQKSEPKEKTKLNDTKIKTSDSDKTSVKKKASEPQPASEPKKTTETKSVSESNKKKNVSETIALVSDKVVAETAITTIASLAPVVTATTTSAVESTPELNFGNTAVIQVQDSGNGTPIEQLMANAMLTADGNYVLMAQTEDGQMTGLPSELNLSDVINASGGGQTFLIETPEGLVACTASTSGEDGAIQLIPAEAGDLENAVISSVQTSGNLVDNQLIQTITGGQSMSYTFNSNSGCLELTAVNPPPVQTPPAKPSRARGNRTPKPKVVPPVSSMGQTLLLSADTSAVDSPTVPTKAAPKRRGGGGKGGRGSGAQNSTVNSSNATNVSNTQLKSNTKTVFPTTESMKLSINNSLTPTANDTTSQLAASRRTYSKKSNIVWITPDASQGATNTPFATVATASAIHLNTPQKQTISQSITNKNSSQSPTRLRTPSPTKTVSQTESQITPSIPNKPMSASMSKPLTGITSGANSTTTQSISPIKATNKSTPAATTKIITASKTAVKTSTQITPKTQTPNLSIKSSPITKTETATKTTIRVSDITATKTPVTAQTPKPTASKTLVTLSSSTKSKTSISKSTPTPITSTKPILSNKSIVSSPASPTKVSTLTTSSSKLSSPTVVTTSVSKSMPTSATKATPASAVKPEKKLKVNELTTSDTKTTTISQNITLTKDRRGGDVLVESSLVTTSADIKSNNNSTVSSTKEKKSLANSGDNLSSLPKTPTTETSKSTRSVETRHSARLSPSKQTTKETKEISSKRKDSQTPTDSVESNVESLKTVTDKEELKNKSVLETDTKNKSKAEVKDNESTTSSTPKTTEKIKKSELKVETTDSSDANKSVRKSRRNSKNNINVEENRKLKDNKPNETKTKDILEKPKEKVEEISSENISTRRTSRKKDLNTTTPEVVVSTPTTETSVTTPSTPTLTSGRVTRASSVKKPEPKVTEKDSKSSNKSIKEEVKEKETEKVMERTDLSKDFDRIMEQTKPLLPQKPVETPVVNTLEKVTPNRSIKKRVQFEIKEKPLEQMVDKTDEEMTKTPETGRKSLTRRSLRSSTPHPSSKALKSDDESKPIVSDIAEDKSQTETDNKTPQRFSTRKRKEIPKSISPEPEVRAPKSPKRSTKNEIEKTLNIEKSENSLDSSSTGRLRHRRSKEIARNAPKIQLKDPIRRSLDSSEPLGRMKRTKSLIQSFIDENEWQEKEDNLRRKTISSLSDLRSPNECYDYSTNECCFYIRHQSLSLTPKQSGSNYLCQKCGFQTTRINNLVVHHREQCTYMKNAVIQQWQSELQKRVRPVEPTETDTSSTSKSKRRKFENNDELNNSLNKNSDESDNESEEEEKTDEKVENNEKPNQNPTISDIDAMLMGSDDEDLLSIDNIENPKREFGFSEDDIVWVDTNSTHWPALVSKVFPKEKKAMIRLIDSPWPKKSMKINITSISLFDSAEMNKKYLGDGRKGSNGDLLVKAVQKAEEFLRKKCLGSELNATKFFEQIDSDLSEANVDEDERLNANSNDVSTHSKETTNATIDSVSETTGNSHPIANNSKDSEVDALPESNEAIAQWKEKRRQQNAKLLQCIKEGKVETHLLGVYRETISSERHQKFRSGSESEKNQLKHVPWFGPIDDEEQQEEIYDYCSQLFKANFKTDGSFDTVAYIFEVWVPEAIVKAISRVRRIELKDSESIFAKGVILSKSEKDELTKEIQKEAEKQMTSQTSSE